MAEDDKKTDEEIKKAQEATAGTDGAAKKAEEDQDTRTPEEKLIAELQGKLEVTEARAKTAEEQRDAERIAKDAAKKDASTAVEREVIAQEDKVKSALLAAKSDFASAQKDWDDAYDSGDKARLRAAQEKLNDAQMQLRGAEYNEKNFAAWKENNKGKVVSAEKSAFSKVEQDWIEKNPRFNTDRKFRAAVFAADSEAKEKGIVVDSSAYFEHIESYLADVGLKGGDAAGNDDDNKPAHVAKKPEKQKSSEAAPVNNSSGGGNGTGTRQKTIQLTPEMREAAAFTFPALHKKDPAAAEAKYAKYQLEKKEKGL